MATINYKFADGHFEEIEVTEEFKREYEFLLVQEKVQEWKIKKQKLRAGMKFGRDVSLERLYEKGCDMQSNKPDPLEIYIAKEELQENVSVLLNPLTDKQRAVYILHLQGLNQTQIARTLNLAVSSVNERLQNAKKRILEIFLKNPKK